MDEWMSKKDDMSEMSNTSKVSNISKWILQANKQHE